MKTLFSLIVLFVSLLLFTCGKDDDMTQPEVTGPEVPMDDTLMYCEASVINFPDTENWELAIVNEAVHGSINMLSATNGIVVNGTNVYKTTDGLSSLVQLEGTVPEDRFLFEAITEETWMIAQHDVNEDGYFVTTLVKTEDAGISWDTIVAESIDLLLVTSLDFVDDTLGFIITSIPFLDSGYSTMSFQTTTDGGHTWTRIEGIGDVKEGRYRSMLQFANETRGYLTGRPWIYETLDRGMTFERLPISTQTIDSYVANETTLFNNSYTETYKSSDGGQSWTTILDRPATVLKAEGDHSLLLTRTGLEECLNEDGETVYSYTWSFVEGIGDDYTMNSYSDIIGPRFNFVATFPEVAFFRMGATVISVM